MQKAKTLTAALTSCLVCCAIPTDDVQVTTQAVVSSNGVSLNGVSLNGVSLNGVSLNGVSLNGVSLNGVSLNGVSLNGVSLNGVSLNGSSLTGVRTDNGESITVDSVGTTMTATLSNGATLDLRIDAAATLAAPNTDVWSYNVSYESDLGWLPLCGSASTGALAVAGTWNTQFGAPTGGDYTPSTTSFTFACRANTVAKCVEMGYKTWRGYTPQLESCVRLLRGDYCGDGTPYTVTGHQVNIYDNVGVQLDTSSWKSEAEWGPGGALCISKEQKTRFGELGLSPSCLPTLPTKDGCVSEGFVAGAVLMSEVPSTSSSASKSKL